MVWDDLQTNQLRILHFLQGIWLIGHVKINGVELKDLHIIHIGVWSKQSIGIFREGRLFFDGFPWHGRTINNSYGKIHHFIAGKIHYNWPFLIAMLVYQRVASNLTMAHIPIWLVISHSIPMKIPMKCPQ